MRSAVWGGVDYPVTQPFALGVHDGIDIGCPSGTIIYAARAGVVERVQTGMVSVRVGAQRDFYLHGTSLVAVGQAVAQGQPVIKSGAITVDPRYLVTGPHLHFEVQNGFSLPGAPPAAQGAPLDPVPVLLAALTFGGSTDQLGDTDLTPAQESKLNEIWILLQNGGLTIPSVSPDDPANKWWLVDRLAALEAALVALKAQVAALPAPSTVATSATLTGELTAPITVTLK